jgi:predicted GNAT family acetyltransferase
LVRVALLSETEEVARLASAMSFEEIQMDPLKDFREPYLQLIASRIQKKRYYVLKEDGIIKFQVHLNSVTPFAGQISGVYTPPFYRQQGYAKRGMRQFCADTFRQVPTLCLFVNDFNAGAVALYEALGFQRTFDYRAIFLEEIY